MLPYIFISLVCFAATIEKSVGLLYTSTHFVAACPWAATEDETFCDAYITTSEKFVEVSIHQNPNIYSQLTPVHDFRRVEPDRPHHFRISTDYGYDQTSPIWAYPVWIISSNGPVKVIVKTYSIDYASADLLNLAPKGNCYSSYYTVTGNGYPFFTIITFEYESTNIDIKFPKFSGNQKDFNLHCFGTVNCAPNTVVKLHLRAHQAWYFTLNDDSSSLHNVLITADLPVNVISGNSYPSNVKGHSSTTDLCTTSLKPSLTWGKTYIIPNNIPKVKGFRVSSMNYPLTIKVHETVKSKVIVKEYKIKSPENGMFQYETLQTFAITANVPFGLYQTFLRKSLEVKDYLNSASILNLIPVEQWKHGVNYIDPPINYDQNSFNIKYYLITHARPKDILFANIIEEEVNLKWHQSTIVIEGKTYSVAEMNLTKRKTRIYVRHSIQKMILYVVLSPKNDKMGSLSSYPYDFYQGEIYQENCSISDKFRYHDGKDNDCDNLIDEELMNSFDDDGDGKIDEDSVAIHSDGEWTRWIHVCRQTCKNRSLEVRVRDCMEKSTYGQPCGGPSVQCDGKECPLGCRHPTQFESDCACNFNCQTCEKNMFECDSCKPGNVLSEHCLMSCPKGWTGVGCSEPEELETLIDFIEGGSPIHNGDLLVVGLFILVTFDNLYHC